MNAAIVYTLLEDWIWDLRGRLEIIMRAMALLNPECECCGDESDEDTPLGMYS